MVVAGGMGQHLKDLKDPEEQLETLIQVGSMRIGSYRDNGPVCSRRSPVTGRVAMLMGNKQCSCKDINLPSLCELSRALLEGEN